MVQYPACHQLGKLKDYWNDFTKWIILIQTFFFFLFFFFLRQLFRFESKNSYFHVKHHGALDYLI